MHPITSSNQQFPIASILNLLPTEFPDVETDPPDEPEARLRIVDGLVSVTRCCWAEPFDLFGNFAA